MQEARLQLLMQLLKQREEQHNDLNVKRLDRLWSVVSMRSRTKRFRQLYVVIKTAVQHRK